MDCPQTLPEKRNPDWPKVCQKSWASTFQRWKESGEPKELSPKAIDAIHHALHCNLLYINELEEKLASHA